MRPNERAVQKMRDECDKATATYYNCVAVAAAEQVIVRYHHQRLNQIVQSAQCSYVRALIDMDTHDEATPSFRKLRSRAYRAEYMYDALLRDVMRSRRELDDHMHDVGQMVWRAHHAMIETRQMVENCT